MRNTKLFQDFAPASKAQWRQQIDADPRAAPTLDTLTWPLSDGLEIAAYATHEDLARVHAQHDAQTQPQITWAQAGSWKVAMPFESGLDEKGAAHALENGVDAFWVEIDNAAQLEDLAHLMDTVHVVGKGVAGFRGVQLAERYKLKGIGTLSLFMDSLEPVEPELLKTAQTIAAQKTACIHLAGVSPESPASDLAQAAHWMYRYLSCSHLCDIPWSHAIAAVQFVFPLSPVFYLEIARFRAFRLVLAKLVHEIDPTYTSPLNIPFIADTTTKHYRNDNPHSNVLRSTTMAMSAIFGGCAMLILRPFSAGQEKALALRLARNTQLILKHESHLDRFTDPMAGAYYVELLTLKLADAVWREYLELRG